MSYTSKFAPLSSLDLKMSYEEVIDFLLDNRYIGIVNDLTPEPHVEYDLTDLRLVWYSLRKQL
jgi:hypothetical protein